MEIVEMVVDEQDLESGIEAISVVDHPAIELDFIALNNQRVALAEIDKEKRIFMGAILTPNKPIYRNQEGKEFYIYFTKDTVRKCMEIFFKRGNQSNATEMHAQKIDGCTLIESWIKEDEVNDKSVKYGLSAPMGTWFGTMKIDNEDIYQKAKKGELKGFSIEGYFAERATLKKDEIQTDINKNRSNNMNVLEMLGLSKKAEIKMEEIPFAENTDVIFEAEMFEPGASVVMWAKMNPDDKMPVPPGDYPLEDGRVLQVVEEGIIASVEGTGQEAMPEPSAPVNPEEQEMEQTNPKKIIESTVKETQFEDQKEEVKEEVVEVFFNDKAKAEIAEIVRAVLAEMKETEDIKVEASEVKPIKHSPESKEKKVMFNFRTNRTSQQAKINKYLFE